ncbi:BRAC1 domain containing protein [Entamoeba histolytica HM-1:IMSS-B]|uniref:BRCT domain-containing protein n=9 Tax=Entamoeba TaxID=5758 RepID=C4M4C8_ENTH1|nr:uncharacterized protein EDI_238180 [Entamoeba dispar SAW760]XP_008860161.1 BRAC1 domain containing protein [Entamoeba nuttalli P19]XP_652916.1 hypothetical protein EHI_156280 [Entamoeba histolytica HM-1:IMSS]EMD44945.1 BRCA1 C terminus (BRCT) domain containing protein [Entamoeba histolytica KU27]EMH74154.1 BRAC1 domain containing protein [Entamoeba histolytica HM-1:IMSS-B]EMS12678.1 BRCA1 C Terminus (BRCT) domain containing protein [Entamoeba histolytica HM-3:IMSS]ENY66010.1 BRCA1 C Termin|eukprot:EDR29252.1 hypothetical protein EDI_238180 [Entamoeba dispar SAW760]
MNSLSSKTINQQFFNGYIISLSGFSVQEKLIMKGMIEECGGMCTDDMNSSTITFLIAKALSSEKARCALRWGVPVLNFQWLFDCLKEGRVISINKYVLNTFSY